MMSSIPESSQAEQNRRKKPSSLSSYARSFVVAGDDANSDRGRKSKSKQRLHNRHLPENAMHNGSSHPVNISESIESILKKERSRSRDSQRPPRSTASGVEPSATRTILDLRTDYSGPPAAAELIRLKREIEILKKVCTCSQTIRNINNSCSKLTITRK